MTDQQIISDAAYLVGSMAAREQKWIRSFNRVANNNRRSDNIFNPMGQPLSYVFNSWEQDLGVTPVLNICKSCVDTHISKLGQTKVRPFFNALNGGFRTRKIIRSTQQLFDQMFNEQGIYQEAIEAAKDADIFECGHLWVDDEDGRIKRLKPWEFYYDRGEYQFKKLSRVMIRFRNYPLYSLRGKLGKMPELKMLLQDETRQPVTEYCIYYDLDNQMKYEIIGGNIALKKKIDYNISPVATMWYQAPIKGGYSTSMVDDIYSLQTELDQTMDTIHQAMSLSPANTIFIPEGSDVKPSMLTNQIGQIIQFNAAGGLSSPITISTPSPISPAYLEYAKWIEEKAYNITGLSQLSAQSKKPSGLNSGVALQTLEDVESERNEIPLQNYMKLLMDITKIYIACMPDASEVLPVSEGRAKVTFGDVRKEMAKLSIQYSPASALSKDPMVKMQQLEKMVAMQMVPPDRVASMMEIPDLEKVFSTETASLDVCERIIERAVEGSLNWIEPFYETVNIDQLINLTSFYVNRFDANDEDPAICAILIKLIIKATEIKDSIIVANTPPAMEPVPLAPPPPVPVQVVPTAPVQGPGQVLPQ